MKKSTPLRSRSREEGPNKEDKRITRMHQMEQMEAAARGTKPSMTLDTTEFAPAEQPPVAAAAQEEQQSPPPSTTGTFERTALVAGDFLSSMTSSSSKPEAAKKEPPTTSGSDNNNNNASSNNLFSKRDIYEVDQSVNLMDASSKKYHHNGHEKKSFVDIFVGSSGSTSGNGKVKTSWKRSAGGRIGIGLLFLGFGLLLALSVSFLASETSYHDEPHIRATAAPKQDLTPLSSEAAATGPAEFADFDFDTKVQDTARMEDLKTALVHQKAASSDRLKDDSTSAFHALRWLTDDDPAQLEANDPELVSRFALASVFYATHQPSSGGAAVQRQFLENKQTDQTVTSWSRENAWMTDHNVCEWFGVDCEVDQDARVVVHLNLTSNQLQGTIPDELQLLDRLILLDLSNNALTGEIPTQLGSLSNTKYLLLHKNALTGTIPEELKHMTSAFEIYLSENDLTGTIPMSLGSIETLRALYLSQNQLSGKINHWKGFNDINHLHLDDNLLEGPLPTGLGQLSMLLHLRLSNNKLTGTLPTELAEITKLRLLYLANNQLTGQIPDMFDDLHKLTDLELHGNGFKSKLPPSMGSLTSLRRLTLEGNTMTGRLPPQWGKMTDLEALDLYRNELIGSIPTEYGGMRNMRDLILSHNFLQEDIPSELGLMTRLKFLDLQHNALRGTVPTEFGKLKDLEKLNLQETLVSGSVPEEVCELDLEVFETDCKSKIECTCCTKCY